MDLAKEQVASSTKPLKFESRSARTKGLAFAPKRPWLLASLHNGVIQMWDYRMGTLIDRFDEHQGPVRSVHFHPTEELFVSGGDDYKIKVWDYKQRRCLFTLTGHLDYIRTVQFHHELPWILSSSDDQTIRIWNWKTRQCISTLTGHNHYVMCAQWHPKEDLIASGSLDQTLRVWDFSALRAKHQSGGAGSQPRPNSNRIQLGEMNQDLFGSTDAVMKYVLEGHERGINWVAWHPTLNQLASVGDDRQIKLWRINDVKAWEVDSLRGHFHNVCCVVFHPRQDLLLSNSEDRSVRVWDLNKRTGLNSYRRERDRFWILAAHPNQNIFAAGHDSGMIVFKLERERPCHTSHKNALFYVKDRYLRTYEFSNGRDVPVLSIRRPAGAGSNPRSISYNPMENAVLICSDADGGTYELYHIQTDPSGQPTEPKRGIGSAAVFVARTRFAVLDKSGSVYIKDLKNTVLKRINIPLPTIENMFYAGAGQLLLKSDDKVALFDVQRKAILAEMPATGTKYVVWSADFSHVALLAKHSVVIANRNLEQLATVSETIRVKSAAWDDSGVLVYTTLNHMKFLLPNGDSGIIRTLDVPIYLTKAHGSTIWCLDRDGKNRVLGIDATEFKFKLALSQGRYSDVVKMVKNSRLAGQAIIGYLQKKGFPEVALHLVQDEQTKFNLALESGNIDVAIESATAIEDKDAWASLGAEALRQGRASVVERAYQQTKNFERLSFLYLATGNGEKLQKMLKIAEMRGDVMSRFQNALYLGDVGERVKLLDQAGQTALAYVTAATHGLAEVAAALAERLTAAGVDVAALAPLPGAKALLPPVPIMRGDGDDWPQLVVSQSVLSGLSLDDDEDAATDEEGAAGGLSGGWGDAAMDGDDGGAPDGMPGGWGDDEDGGIPGMDDVLGEGGVGGDAGGDGEGWGDDLVIADLPALSPSAVAAMGAAGGAEEFFVVPTRGKSQDEVWAEHSQLAGFHAAAGSWETAMMLLNSQVGVVNFEPLRPFMSAAWSAAHTSVPGLPGLSTMGGYVSRRWDEPNPAAGQPAVLFTLPPLVERLKQAYLAVTNGRFGEASTHFKAILCTVPLLVVETRQNVNEVKELVGICREYLTGLRLEAARRETKDDPIRQLELAAYFTHQNLKPAHLALTLQLAMKWAYKVKNFTTASGFCRRLLELSPKREVAAQARQVLAVCEKQPGNAAQMRYDERNPFVVDGIDLLPIYRGNPTVTCPMCGASFAPAHKGKLCPTCGLSEIGADCAGLMVSLTQFR